MKRWAELVGATTLLTRLPVGGLVATHPSAAACVWAYPVVGALVGGIGAAVLAIGLRLGLSQPVAAIWALAAIVLATGGLHEDGLADTADGFGGGRTVERKLAIMRDSRIGSYGALALGFSLALRLVALALSTHPAVALILAGVLGRGAMLLPLLLLRAARPDGLAATLETPSRTAIGAGLLIAAAASWFAPTAGLAALLAGLALTALARRQIGGYSGDVFGATEQLAECAALSIL
ncbi:adenosylcobinamide-GDP ribazoletransferase [Acidisphaera sp. L21]|jgi:adenosylcobinamide-GDP ribazoletransferase|uniref:adenosylcobinamide-GDP ribazoletransferase n=1 Tax=Acidisphaera sp. L21 TaxID=1641851 RepID=UPI00131D5AB2|nr:adenosylcobinamide-GDP ribazoletransferase [Acidisphaera sp. L21]